MTDETEIASLTQSLLEAETHIQSLELDLAKLQDPVAVHMNMLKGTIAKISLRQCAHLHAATEELSKAEEVAAELCNGVTYEVARDSQTGFILSIDLDEGFRNRIVAALIEAEERGAKRAMSAAQVLYSAGANALVHLDNMTPIKENLPRIEHARKVMQDAMLEAKPVLHTKAVRQETALDSRRTPMDTQRQEQQ